MQLAELVATSNAIAATPARNAKIELLAGLLGRLGPAERPIAIAWLSGELRQGRIGLGGAALAAAWNAPAPPDTPPSAPSLFDTLEPASPAPSSVDPLTVLDVDAAFDRLAGAG